MPKEWINNGWIKKAESIEALAQQIGVDEQALADSVRRFNAHAINGQDPDFGRGESQYNKVLGDPGNKPNPALGPIETGPFYATEIYPGDVGTIGGVVTNEHAQVVDQSDDPIPGLYAAGNMAATVWVATTWGPAPASPTRPPSATSRRVMPPFPQGPDGRVEPDPAQSIPINSASASPPEVGCLALTSRRREEWIPLSLHRSVS